MISNSHHLRMQNTFRVVYFVFYESKPVHSIQIPQMTMHRKKTSITYCIIMVI